MQRSFVERTYACFAPIYTCGVLYEVGAFFCALAHLHVPRVLHLQNFLGGQDEEHFRVVHVDIEAKAAPAVQLLRSMQASAAEVRTVLGMDGCR